MTLSMRDDSQDAGKERGGGNWSAVFGVVFGSICVYFVWAIFFSQPGRIRLHDFLFGATICIPLAIASFIAFRCARWRRLGGRGGLAGALSAGTWLTLSISLVGAAIPTWFLGDAAPLKRAVPILAFAVVFAFFAWDRRTKRHGTAQDSH